MLVAGQRLHVLWPRQAGLGICRAEKRYPNVSASLGEQAGSTGLHFHDIEHLLAVLHKLRDEGNTIVVIEHNLDVIKTADWVVDLGPEGGHRGGRILATGTPEEIAAHPESHTGRFLAKLLPAAKAPKPTKPAAVARPDVLPPRKSAP